ncbi:MAG: glycoside hydrolase family 16 protein [bacterium]|nr:glycoside hydrolase family 16 protein [bacterium]MCP4799122.1 glycoside hydrolase family 16 protein [bacterium]
MDCKEKSNYHSRRRVLNRTDSIYIFIIFLLMIVVGCSYEPYSPGSNNNDPIEYTLVWEDNFDGPANQSPEDSNWSFDVGGHGWGNQQLEFDTARTENVSLDGSGNLRIIAIEEEYLGRNYTSGRIKTEGKFSQKYGRFEARIKLPVGQGLWPAFWLLGSDFSSVGWPDCGEIDIMEYRGQSPNVVNGALHGPGYSGATPLVGSYHLSGDGFNEGFHVFAIEWTSNSISWIVDDYTYMTKVIGDLPGNTSWVFDHPFFIILNVAVGGHYVGSPDQSTVFPQTMYIDYVRVYEGN